jgi:ankyrin repeat protein
VDVDVSPVVSHFVIGAYCGHALNQAAPCCTPEIFALLLSHGAVLSNATPVHYAAGCGQDNRIPMLQYLVEELNLDINGLDYALTIPEDCRGREGTPLHYALYMGNYEVAKWLLEHGADPDKEHSFPGSPAKMWNQDTPHDERFSELLSRY